MKRHVLGIALFSSIVASAIFASWLFYKPSMPEILPVVPEKVVFSRSKTSCWKDEPQTNKTNHDKVLQAVFNLRTKRLETELLIYGAASEKAWVDINLHFFVKDGKSTRHLGSESVAVAPNFDAENQATHSVVSSFNWLDNLTSYENLYVVAERGKGFEEPNMISSFDEANARPVLLMGDN